MDINSKFSGLRPQLTVFLTISVAILSVITGVANIGSQTLVGPLAQFIPISIQKTAGFTGTLTGFLILTSAIGLRKRLRIAWYSSVFLLPFTALQGLLQSSPLSIPLILLSILALVNILVNKKGFDRSLSLSPSQLAATLAIISAQIYGTVGSYALRDQFADVDTLVDAFYYTLITASTVGYGDITATTQMARLFSMSVVIVGTASFAIALGTLLGPALEKRFSKALGRMTETQLEMLENHILILGYGELTEVIMEEIGEQAEYLIITDDTKTASKIREQGHNVLMSDPSDESSLLRGKIDKARAIIVATNKDKEDALSILTAKQLNPDISILSAATNRENIKKLKRAGADIVISPTNIGAKLLVQSATGKENIENLIKDISIE